jgi:hypothetical protein
LQQNTYENTKRIDHRTNGIGDDTRKIYETAKDIDKVTKRTEGATKNIDETTRNIVVRRSFAVTVA